MPGFFFVYSDPGTVVSEEEFNDWYENEHLPLRIPIPGFQSWSRWVAADDQHPTYAAIYDIASPSVISTSPYTDLAQTRSEREKRILATLGLLDRRTYTLIEPTLPPKAGDAYDPRRPGPYALVVEIEISPEAEEDFNKWNDEEHVPLLAKVPGWVQSRRFVLVDSAVSGTDATGDCTPKYLSVHEWESPESLKTAEFRECVQTPWSKKVQGGAVVIRRRLLKFVRSWERE
ncbi:hypothetical protein C8Q79DRAFT_923138 [Trametes meyenii]|nr:hypothetical protein C8Q79DRAFT_923138 [Trametes meyenii]